MNTEPTFMELVELHERKWGTTQYPGRPSLTALMTSPIVALWSYKNRFLFSVHYKAQDLNDIVDNLVRTGEYFALTGEHTLLPECRLTKIFVNKQPIEFNVRIVSIDESDNRQSSKATVHHVKEAPGNSYKLNGPDLVPLRRQPDVVPLNHQPDLIPLRPRTFSAVPENEGLKYGDIVKVNLPHLPGRHVDWRLIQKRLVFGPPDEANNKKSKR